MSTSDQQGNTPLTRKQLREIRMTGSTPVITPEEAAAAPPTPPEAPEREPVLLADEPSDGPTDSAEHDATEHDSSRLTRRQAREQERVRTASVPVLTPESTPVVAEEAAEAPDAEESAEAVEEPVDESSVSAEHGTSVDEAPVVDEAESAEVVVPELVSGVPTFDDLDDDRDDDVDEELLAVPVSAAAAAETAVEVPDLLDEVSAAEDAAAETGAPEDLGLTAEEVDEEAEIESGERPTVSPAFGKDLLVEESEPAAFTPSFDELLTVSDSTGSQHIAPNALIFTQSPGEGSLSGPVAATGEVLVTGSYELPEGLGSQGHARGTTDGKDVDAVLIDGELPPASSPTPIAASSAISTIKPAGEVIRPPAPEKGNKLMLVLAIIAGGLALALAVALVVAFTMNVL